MDRIKIIYLVDFLRTINAGTERQLGHLLERLPERGYSIWLISFQTSPFLEREFSGMFPGVEMKTLGAKSDLSKSIPSLIRLLFLMRRIRPDIVHTFFPDSNSVGILIAKLAGVKNLISSRRDMGYDLTSKVITRLKIANRFVPFIVANCRAVEEQAIRLENIREQKIRVIYNGILEDVYAEIMDRKEEKDPIIGIVANLNRPIKRVDLFVKAARIIHKDFPNAKFWIVGDGPLRKELEELTSKNGLNSSLVFWGRRDDVHKLLSQITIGVISSDTEGLSNSIMEYMQMGLPVVATDVGGNRELVNHGVTGYLVPPNDEEALAEKIIKLLKEPKSMTQMGKLGKEKIINQFSIEKMVRETIGLYEFLMAGF